MGPDPHPDDPQELTATPRDPVGWHLPAALRCIASHEVEPACTYRSGVLVGYCKRCDARVELPWLRGGTAAMLADTLATEAMAMALPAPSVVIHLDDVLAMLRADAAEIAAAIDRVVVAKALALDRMPI